MTALAGSNEGFARMARRRAVGAASSSWVLSEWLDDTTRLPRVMHATVDGVRLDVWVREHVRTIETELSASGGILFRGFDVGGVEGFEGTIAATSSEWAEYREAATPRSAVSDRVQTSTDYSPSQPIFVHNENSHCASWPLKIYFFCITPADRGGETPIVDCRRVFARLDERVRRRFLDEGILYVRNFGDHLGFPWAKVFRTENPRDVEAYCQANRMTCEWRSGGRLRVRYVRPAARTHPTTGQWTWFNHGTFFHVSTLDAALRRGLEAGLAEDELPYNTYYGGGGAIEPDVLDALRAAYHAETVTFSWKAGDVLMLDNMLVAHGRRPFDGPRRVVVGMADPTGSRGGDPL